jgi:hypothetical protein
MPDMSGWSGYRTFQLQAMLEEHWPLRVGVLPFRPTNVTGARSTILGLWDGESWHGGSNC